MLLDDLNRQKARRGFRRFRIRKPRVLQPVENLIYIHVIPTGYLRNRYTTDPSLRADHSLLVIAPVAPPASLLHKVLR